MLVQTQEPISSTSTSGGGNGWADFINGWLNSSTKKREEDAKTQEEAKRVMYGAMAQSKELRPSNPGETPDFTYAGRGWKYVPTAPDAAAAKFNWERAGNMSRTDATNYATRMAASDMMWGWSVDAKGNKRVLTEAEKAVKLNALIDSLANGGVGPTVGNAATANNSGKILVKKNVNGKWITGTALASDIAEDPKSYQVIGPVNPTQATPTPATAVFFNRNANRVGPTVANAQGMPAFNPVQQPQVVVGPRSNPTTPVGIVANTVSNLPYQTLAAFTPPGVNNVVQGVGQGFTNLQNWLRTPMGQKYLSGQYGVPQR